MSELEHYSRNLIYGGNDHWFAVVLHFGCMLASLVLAVWLYWRLLAARRPAAVRVAAVVLVLVAPISLLFWMNPLQVFGRIDAVLVEETDAGRVVTANFSRRGQRGPEVKTTMVFAMTGAVLARVPRAGSDVVGEAGGAVVVRDGGSYGLVERHTRRPLVDVNAALDRAHGRGQYQVLGVSDAAIRVLLKDGREDRLDLLGLLPEEFRGAPGVTRRVWLSDPELCATDPLKYRDHHKGRLMALQAQMSLLRPRIVHAPGSSSLASPCAYELQRRALLVLHRSTAFGADGAFLLSALPFDDLKAPLWTTDLSPATGPDLSSLDELQLLDVQVRGDELCFWLTRRVRALSEVCVRGDSGALQSATVVF